MTEILKAVLFGIVEGITEWLPISSTGHIILLNEFVKLNVSPEFWNMFLVVIQFGAILAVILLYWNTIWPFKVAKRGKDKGRIVVRRQTLMMWAKAIVACIPAGVVGILLDDWLEEHLQNWQCVSIMLVLVGIAFIVIEKKNEGKEPVKTKMSELTFRDAFLIGIFQLIAAVFPGTSRSGATILGGLSIGISRTLAAKFTFILAIPVMAGASLLKIVKYGFHFTTAELSILGTGMAVAFVVSFIVIRLLMNYIRSKDFKPFAVYRIILGLVMALYFGLLRG